MKWRHVQQNITRLASNGPYPILKGIVSNGHVRALGSWRELKESASDIMIQMSTTWFRVVWLVSEDPRAACLLVRLEAWERD